jgi:hypothetical protein
MSDRFKRHIPKQAPRAARAGSKGTARPKAAGKDKAAPEAGTETPKEIGGPAGPEPTRYGDWEVGGRCVDF